MKNYSTEIKWGLIFSLVAMGWMYFEKAMGWHGPNIEQHPTYTNLFAVLAIAVFVFALRDKKHRDYGGHMTWRQGFFSGALISLVVAVLSPLAQWLTHTVISPEYFPNVIAYSVAQGYYETEAAAAAFFNLQSYMLQGAIGGMVMGLLTSAIVPLFLRSRPS
ncbi:DUF4199 domain-containing protein [Phaeodactylibacter luteus]|uniref:DUF4199 domain-containing protein n=1 Tax=Phaeodactylibacter luteus TaxID=1564516 RepID=A0A5C6RN24_9BACT|nr:DUF4199 domain-containing protein [Phaeodactylibacter luteus]TXB63374.1 DUF4199 domain-containing protein [Phaeodactylibacter luteus]